MDPSDDALNALRAALRAACRGLVGREGLVELVLLAAVAGEHLLVVGPPGTAKSAALRRVGEALGGRTFEYLLGRFTEPAELFGPVDLRRLKEGVVAVDTAGMLPEADFVFLDELFLGSTAILNTLLPVLNEGRFRRGSTDVAVPLRLCVAASNALPRDPSLAALADRFLVRAFVHPLGDDQLEALLASADLPSPPSGQLLGALDALRARVGAVDLQPARAALAAAVRTLRDGGILLTDRRVVRAQRLVAAAAALAGRTTAGELDLWPLLYAVPTEEEQRRARALLPALLAAADHPLLTAALVGATDGPAALASRLVARLAALQQEGASALLLRGWLRDVDVAFAPADRPGALAAARERAIAALGAAGG